MSLVIQDIRDGTLCFIKCHKEEHVLTLIMRQVSRLQMKQANVKAAVQQLFCCSFRTTEKQRHQSTREHPCDSWPMNTCANMITDILMQNLSHASRVTNTYQNSALFRLHHHHTYTQTHTYTKQATGFQPGRFRAVISGSQYVSTFVGFAPECLARSSKLISDWSTCIFKRRSAAGTGRCKHFKFSALLLRLGNVPQA